MTILHKQITLNSVFQTLKIIIREDQIYEVKIFDTKYEISNAYGNEIGTMWFLTS